MDAPISCGCMRTQATHACQCAECEQIRISVLSIDPPREFDDRATMLRLTAKYTFRKRVLFEIFGSIVQPELASIFLSRGIVRD